MGRVIDYTARTSTDLDGTEVTYLSDGGSYKLSIAELLKFARKDGTPKPVVQGTVTAMPTSLPVTPGVRNLYWVNTSGGSIDVSTLGSLGGTLPAGYSVIFRKTTRDTNRVRFSETSGGTALTKTGYSSLYKHYVDEPKEIELVWDGSTWQLISESQIDYSLDMTGATDCRASLFALLTDYTGNVINLPPGRIKIDGIAAGGSYPVSGALPIPAGTTIIGHPMGTEIYCDTPVADQVFILINSNVKIKDVNFTLNPSCTRSATVIIAAAYSVTGISLDNVVFSGGGQLQNDLVLSTGNIIFRDVTKSTVKNSTFRWTRNAYWGFEMLGCEDILFKNCFFTENGGDGIKAYGDNTYFELFNIRFNDCWFTKNGQADTQLPAGSAYVMQTATYTGSTSLVATTGARYRFDAIFPSTMTLPASTNTGKYIFVGRVAGSAATTIAVASGTLTGMNASANLIPMTTLSSPNYNKTTLKLTEVAGGWVATEHGNGEGVDINGTNVSLVNCVAEENQGTGFQLKNASGLTYSSSGCSFVSCIARNNFGNGFAIVNEGGTTVPPMTGNMFTNCISVGNYSQGYNFTTGAIHNLSLANCIARSNGGGINLQQFVRNATIDGCQFLGNKNLVAGGNYYNAQITAASNVKFTNCSLSGADAIRQGIFTLANLDNPSNASCYGFLIQKTESTYTLTNLIIDKCTVHNHIADYTYWTTYAVTGAESDFQPAHMSTINELPMLWVRKPTDNLSSCIVVGVPGGNVISDLSNGNNGLISGAESSAPNTIRGPALNRWMFGGYDNVIDQTVSTYFFGANHTVAESSSNAHSMVVGGSVDTLLRNASGAIFNSHNAVLGKERSIILSSNDCASIGHGSVVAGSLRSTIGIYPDVVTSGRTGVVTATTFTAGNPVVGQTITANGIAYTQSATMQTSTVTFSQSGVDLLCTWTGHLLVAGEIVYFTGGTLPTGIAPDTNYYVQSTSGVNAVFLSTTSGGGRIPWVNNGSGTITGTKRMFTNSGGFLLVNWVGHKLQTNDIVYFTGGVLPTGIVASTSYYVIVVDSNTFNLVTTQLSTTKIAWVDNGSGVVTGRKRNVVLVTTVSGGQTWSNVPWNAHVESVGGSTTVFSFQNQARVTTTFPAIVVSTTWLGVPQGMSMDYVENGGNSINTSSDCHIMRGSYNKIDASTYCSARPSLIAASEANIPKWTEQIGQYCQTNAPYQSAKGWSAKPINFCQRAVAAGAYKTIGDFQRSTNFMSIVTTDANPTLLKCQASQSETGSASVGSIFFGGEMYVPPYTVWLITGKLVANGQNSFTDLKCWTFSCVLEGGAAGGTDFGIVTKRSLTSVVEYTSGTAAANNMTWDVDTAVYGFRPKATAASGGNVVWRMTFEALEIGKTTA